MKPTRSAILLITLVIVLMSTGYGQKEDIYLIKSVFIQKFTRFIQWPNIDTKENKNENTPVIIRVLGQTPITTHLEKLFVTETIKERKVNIESISSVEEIGNCHILFIASHAVGDLPNIIKRIAQKPILTVGDSRGFVDKGGMINFIQVKKKVSFELNIAPIRKSTLRVTSLLLRAAERVVNIPQAVVGNGKRVGK